MSDNKMKFHITITNNETGEILHDTDACAILASVNEGHRTGSILMTDCSTEELVETLNGAERATQSVYKDHPELRALAVYLKILNAQEQSEEPETEETENNQ